ncbi:MAG: NUDIX hydrolase [Anaerolineae bacterium]|nr:NUDIX hydrolase [Anaerolineae bacterium]
MAFSNFTAAVEGAIIHEGRYLMIVRSEHEDHAAGVLAFPGGSVEPGDDEPSILEKTLRREIREETSVTIGDELVYLESTRFPMDDGRQAVLVTFMCRYASGTPTVVDPLEVAEVGWMAASEILNHAKTPSWLRATLEHAEAKRLQLGW